MYTDCYTHNVYKIHAPEQNTVSLANHVAWWELLIGYHKSDPITGQVIMAVAILMAS